MANVRHPHEPGYYRRPPFFLSGCTGPEDIFRLKEEIELNELKLYKLEKNIEEGVSPPGDVESLMDWLDDAEYTLDELIGKYGQPKVWVYKSPRWKSPGLKERAVKRNNLGQFVRWYAVGER